MKNFILVAIALLLSNEVLSQQYIQGYCKPDGTCVQGHFRTRPNDTAVDNYSSRGNLNPNTGRISTREVEIPVAPGIGPRGGQYYINENGRKVYVRSR